MTQQVATPYDFGEKKVILTNHAGKRIDISALVIELNFFEAINRPYVSGSLMVIDSANVFNSTNFLGQESLEIEVTDIYGATKISKEFVVSKVQRQEKTSDSTSAYAISFIERHMYTSKMKRFSKSYVGKPEIVLSNILSEQLGLTVRAEGSSQSSMRYLAPFTMSAMESADILKGRCTTADGQPFFLHSSLYTKDELSLVSLTTLLGQQPFNTQATFKYATNSKTEESSYTTESFDSLTYRIASMDLGKNQEVLDILSDAGYGAQYLWMETFDEKSVEERMKIIEPLGSAPKPNGKMDYDPSNTIGGKPLHEGVAKYITMPVTKKVFDDGQLSFDEEQSMSTHIRRAKSYGMRAFSVKGAAIFQCPGFAFLGEDIIGKKQIDIYVPKDLPIEGDYDEDFVKDKKRSGQYVVAGIRHMFKNSQYSATVTAVKIDNNNNLDAEQFYRGEP